MQSAVFLGGGGSEVAEKTVWAAFLRAIPGPRLLYVPAALGEEPDVLAEAERWFRDALRDEHPDRPVEVSVSRDFAGVHPSAFDGLFLGGGNTYVLRAAIDRAHGTAAIRAVSLSGKPIYGGSAGATVLGQFIDISDDPTENSRVATLRGLDILGGLSCSCHYTPAHDQKILAYVADKSAAVLALPEEGGAVYEHDSIKALGSKPIAIFTASTGAPFVLSAGEGLHVSDWTG